MLEKETSKIQIEPYQKFKVASGMSESPEAYASIAIAGVWNS